MDNYSNTTIKNISQSSFSKAQIMSKQLFDKWRTFIYENCGIYFQDNKKYLLESRLLKRINYLNLDSYDDYFNYIITSVNENSEKKYLYEAITINETYFFRNQPQLDALIKTIIPEIVEKQGKNNKAKIRIWSAASSSGEEAYSAAISIADLLMPRYPNLEYEVVGTDISYAVIETAKQGIYKEYAIRNTPAYYLKKYFQSNGNSYQVNEEIKNNVSFKLLNLYDTAGMRSMFNFDIVFCANVLIYFDMNSKIKVINQLYNSLNKGGYLFIGYSETLHNVSKAFKILSFPKTIGYKKE
ncbi:MAG: CheR family methyltransferase [Ignavibacteriaceae bacterium]